MNTLDIDSVMNKSDQMMERVGVVETIKEFFVKHITKAHIPALLFDPDNEVDLEKLAYELGNGTRYFDMRQFKSVPYHSFEQMVMLPFVNSNIKMLLLDNVDCFPDDPQFHEYRGILRSMMKMDLWLIYPDKIKSGEQGHIGMRCKQMPDYKPGDCPALIDCKSDIWTAELKERLTRQ